MFNKFGQTQSTIFTARPIKKANVTIGQSNIKNPFKQTLPLKFPKNHIRKQTQKHMLSQTSQNPQPYSIRVYDIANRSRFSGDPMPMGQTQRMARHPSHFFQNKRKLSNPGSFGHLARQSEQYAIRTRTFQDIGVTNNERRIFSKEHFKPDPIILGERQFKHNSSLQKIWQQPRRHRDNGSQFMKTMNWQIKPSKREPYKVQDPNHTHKNTSYKDMYLKSRATKQGF